MPFTCISVHAGHSALYFEHLVYLCLFILLASKYQPDAWDGISLCECQLQPPLSSWLVHKHADSGAVFGINSCVLLR